MPTYQYRCTECGSELEAVQKFSDPSLTDCPTCSGALRKVYNAVGVVFKGSGFYRNDSRATPAKDGAGAKETVGADSSAKTSGSEGSGSGSGSEGSGSEGSGKSGSGNGAGSGRSGSGNGAPNGSGAEGTGAGKSSDSGSSAGKAKSSSTGSKAAAG